ncbi:hypothetical protein GF377_07955 [candidate division GN15 bacterium]|nr:hypothetical protein [candidate division GN15 bacterium]
MKEVTTARQKDGEENQDNPIDQDLVDKPIPDDLKREITVYRRLKPFIGHCLTLNHDLNNPLAGILGYAEFILTDGRELDDELKSNIDQIVECAERIRERLDSLCDHKLSLVTKLNLDQVTRTYQEYAKDLDTKGQDLAKSPRW